MKKSFVLKDDSVRKHCAHWIMTEAPLGHSVKVDEVKRNLEQNAALWAVLSEISAQVDWYGNKLSSEEWKDVFSASLKKQKVVPGLDGGFVVCGQSTSKMTKSEFSELLELAHAFAAQHGVKLNGAV